ncbi:MAG: hypothetical protein HKO72_04505 [Flavobacteriaceae bacterium]|nr:hypothetical protein [Bacteroidia bacterium]NNL60580.1 hypothetical protein [Flavobacteriaceae bacterium]
MKKITLLFCALLVSAVGFAQTFPGAGGTVPDASCPTTTNFDAAVTGVGTLTSGTLEL